MLLLESKVTKNAGKHSVWAILRSKNTSRSCECSGAIPPPYGPEKLSSHTTTGWSPSCLLVTFPSYASLYPPLAAVSSVTPKTRNMYHIALQTAALPLTSVRNAHKYYVYVGIYIFVIRRGATPSPFHLSSVGDDAHIVPFCYSSNWNLYIRKSRMY